MGDALLDDDTSVSESNRASPFFYFFGFFPFRILFKFYSQKGMVVAQKLETFLYNSLIIQKIPIEINIV